MISFEEDLRQVINRHSAESVSGTPDFILAKLLLETLKTFNTAVCDRADWRGESTELPALIKQPNAKVLSEELDVAIKHVINSVQATHNPMTTLANIRNLRTIYESSNG